VADRHRERIPGFTDLATFQSRLTDASVHDDERYGRGYDVLKAEGFFWVAVRVRAAFFRTAPTSATVELETGLQPPMAAAVDRCYLLRDDAGVFAAGVARWALVRLADGRPVRLTSVPDLFAGRFFEKESPLEGDFVPTTAFTADHIVRLLVPAAGIDRNGHLNNARYWDLVFAATSDAGLPSSEVSAIEIGYRRELHADDAVDLLLRRDGGRILFAGVVSVRDGEGPFFSGHYIIGKR
jgi:acyl-CoA thioesterase FadM